MNHTQHVHMWKWWGAAGLAIAAFLTSQAGAADDDHGEAKLTLDGKSIVIVYGRPSTDGRGYKSMQDGVPDGYLWRLGKDKATTLETEADLKFGDTVVKAGKYSLAGKKTEDGWELLVHPNADRWGSPVPKDGYVATIPLESGEPKEEAELMTIKLKEKEGKGVFVLVWGKEKLYAKFETAG